VIVSEGQIKMVRRGRRWIELPKRPHIATGRTVRLRESKSDKGLLVTVDRIVRYEDRWRVLVRLGDCVEHVRMLSWSGSQGVGVDGDRGYTESRRGAMVDEPEAVSDAWLKRFGEAA
jgi:hypothetical protein